MASSAGTEMVLASDGTMSVGGNSTYIRGVRTQSVLVAINEENSNSGESYPSNKNNDTNTNAD